jgi:AcrR family transcriptional regulator
MPLLNFVNTVDHAVFNDVTMLCGSRPEGDVPARTTETGPDPRGSLSRDKVLTAAFELARGGLDAVSMRALGARLGADPTAVYRYFRTKDELLDAMADAVVAGDRPVPQTGRPADDLATAFENFRASLLAHPALVPVVARRPPGGEATREGADRVLALLSGAGWMRPPPQPPTRHCCSTPSATRCSRPRTR